MLSGSSYTLSSINDYSKLRIPDYFLSIRIPSCSSGYYSKDIYSPCKPCRKGTWQDDADAKVCQVCPKGITTAQAASTNALDCNVCAANACNGHEKSCNVIRGAPSCECNHFYLQFDNCKHPWILYLSASATILAIVLLMSLISWVNKQRQRHRLVKQKLSEKQKQIVELNKVWDIKSDQIQWNHVFDSGACGEVWKGCWRELPVAIKTLHKFLYEIGNEDFLIEFNREVKLLRTLRHPNVVLFYGYPVVSFFSSLRYKPVLSGCSCLCLFNSCTFSN